VSLLEALASSMDVRDINKHQVRGPEGVSDHQHKQRCWLCVLVRGGGLN